MKPNALHEAQNEMIANGRSELRDSIAGETTRRNDETRRVSVEQSADALTLLGNKSPQPERPEDAILDRVPNAYAGRGAYEVILDCPEFTSMCPKTGQPDFAKLTITYTPGEWLIESKALKLYLGSFRNHGMFHEFVVNKIAHDLFERLAPKSITVRGDFMPRGGISIIPVVTLKAPHHITDEVVRKAIDESERRMRVDPEKLLPSKVTIATERAFLMSRVVSYDEERYYFRPRGGSARALLPEERELLGKEWFDSMESKREMTQEELCRLVNKCASQK